MCRPFDRQCRYFYPARGQVTFFYTAVALQLPYVFFPSDPGVWNYIRIFGILYYPVCFSSIFLRYFRWQRLDRHSNRLFLAVPMLVLLSLMVLVSVRRDSFLSDCGTVVTVVAVMCGIFLLARMFSVLCWVWKRVDEYHRQNYSTESDFPYKFAENIVWMPLVWMALLWCVFLTGSRDLKAVTDIIYTFGMIALLCVILHPQRALQPGKAQEDIDRIVEDENEIIGETMASSEDDGSGSGGMSPGWDEESKRQVLDIILRRYKEQHLQKKDVLAEMDKGRAAPASRFIASVGYYNLINMFRLEHARQYIEAHPEAKLAVVAEASGFASGSSFSKAKRSVREIIPEYVSGVHL